MKHCLAHNIRLVVQMIINLKWEALKTWKKNSSLLILFLQFLQLQVLSFISFFKFELEKLPLHVTLESSSLSY